MIKDFNTYINEGLFDRNQSEFNIRKTDRGVEQVYIPSTKEELYKYIDIAIENAKKDRTYPNVNLNNIDISELGNDELDGLFSSNIYMINPDISNWNIKSIPNGFFDHNKKIKEFTIPNSVEMIGNSSFSNCSSLEYVTIPNSVNNIEMWAFSDCLKLKSVVIPNSVTRIKNLAFYGCRSLEYVTIGNRVTSIGRHAFGGCTKLTSVTISKHCRIETDSFPRCCKIIIK